MFTARIVASATMRIAVSNATPRLCLIDGNIAHLNKAGDRPPVFQLQFNSDRERPASNRGLLTGSWPVRRPLLLNVEKTKSQAAHCVEELNFRWLIVQNCIERGVLQAKQNTAFQSIFDALQSRAPNTRGIRPTCARELHERARSRAGIKRGLNAGADRFTHRPRFQFRKILGQPQYRSLNGANALHPGVGEFALMY